MKTVYVLVSKVSTTFGQGEFGHVPVLCTDGSYHSGQLLPAFSSVKLAQEFIDTNDPDDCYNPIIVPLEVKHESASDDNEAQFEESEEEFSWC